MRRPFDTSRASSGLLHGSRFERGILNPRSKRAERPETEAVADTADTTATGKADPAQAETPGRDMPPVKKPGKSPMKHRSHPLPEKAR